MLIYNGILLEPKWFFLIFSSVLCGFTRYYSNKSNNQYIVYVIVHKTIKIKNSVFLKQQFEYIISGKFHFNIL